MKKNNKGFTLVELIVVLVILAILAAILVPALLGYIDRAREKQVTTNAEAAYVAAQGRMADAYKDFDNPAKYITKDAIKELTDIDEGFNAAYKINGTWDSSASTAAMTLSARKAIYKITDFAYYSEKQGKTATWSSTTGNWTVEVGDKTTALGGKTVN